jgi:CheY-like chemotaxis protein
MSSLESQTMVPTLTMFGRVSEWTLLDSKLGALAVEVTQALCPAGSGESRRGAGRFALADTIPGMSSPDPSAARVTVVLYSNSADVRAQVRSAVGRRPAPDCGRIDWVECSTNAEVVAQLDQGELDLVILDGEAQPTGGAGLARQFKYEIDDCPPIVVLIARKQDGWLASWSLADAVLTQPLDPVDAAAVVAEQLRNRSRGLPVVR